MKHSRISRVMQILVTMQSGRSYGVAELAKMFGTSRRTIFRDLKELEAMGVPYHYDSAKGGYVLEPEFFLPPIDLNLKEALSILMLAHKVSDQVQLPFSRSALLAALKIENNLPAEIRRYCQRALRSISARAAAQAPMPSPAGLDNTFARLQNALTKKRKVRIRYHSLLEGREIDVELSPYHLFYNRRAWYVLGYSSLHKSVRTFKLNRIRALEPTDRCFIDDEKFDPAEYFGRAWSMIPEGRIYNVKLRFLPKVARNVSEVKWHSTQEVVFNDDGSVTVEFRVDGLGEITWWILGYGDQVQVLAPRALRKKIMQVARNMLKLNEQV